MVKKIFIRSIFTAVNLVDVFNPEHNERGSEFEQCTRVKEERKTPGLSVLILYFN